MESSIVHFLSYGNAEGLNVEYHHDFFKSILAQCSISICPENLWFSGIFRRYRNGTLEWNVGLKWVKNNLDKSLKKLCKKHLRHWINAKTY